MSRVTHFGPDWDSTTCGEASSTLTMIAAEVTCPACKQFLAVAPPTSPALPARTHKTINLNDYVWVKLKDKGRAMLREQDARWSSLYGTSYGRLPTAERDAAENDGWSSWQLWSLIEAFGPALGLGCDPPFETTIRLVAPAAEVERLATPDAKDPTPEP